MPGECCKCGGVSVRKGDVVFTPDGCGKVVGVVRRASTYSAVVEAMPFLRREGSAIVTQAANGASVVFLAQDIRPAHAWYRRDDATWVVM